MRGRRQGPRVVVGTLVCGLALAGCGSVVPGQARLGAVPSADRALIDSYVDAANRAGEAGPLPQAAFLRATQASDSPFPPPRCFGTLTLDTALVGRTLRPDPDWRPPATSDAPPRDGGAVYVAAAAVSVRRDAAQVREDVGSKHFVVRDDRVFSYAPCPN